MSRMDWYLKVKGPNTLMADTSKLFRHHVTVATAQEIWFCWWVRSRFHPEKYRNPHGDVNVLCFQQTWQMLSVPFLKPAGKSAWCGAGVAAALARCSLASLTLFIGSQVQINLPRSTINLIRVVLWSAAHSLFSDESPSVCWGGWRGVGGTRQPLSDDVLLQFRSQTRWKTRERIWVCLESE